MSRRRLIVVGVLVFVAGIVLLFPARVAYQWANLPGISLSGISGTLWSGRAAEASISGVYLRDLNWRVRLSRLLQARPSYVLDAVIPGGYIDTEVGVSPDGDIHLRDFRGTLALASLQQLVGMQGLQGTVNADISRLRLSDGVPVAADGFVEVGGLVLPAVTRTSLGSFRADLATQDEGVVASVQDTQAVVDLAGRVLLGRDRNYDFLGRVAPTANTPDKLTQQMRILGTPDTNGQYELRLAGRY